MGKPTYATSDGTRYNKDQIDAKVSKAKQEMIDECLIEHGYVFCHTCERNDCKPVDCAHLISVKECQENSETELAWDWRNNMILEGRKCHQKRDGLNIQKG